MMVVFLCSKNHVDVHCLELQVSQDGPPAWIHSMLFSQAPNLGQDGERFALGSGCVTGKGACAEGAAPSQVAASLAAISILQKTSSNTKPNLSVCSDTNNNEELVKMLN